MSHLTPYTRMTHPNMGPDMVPQPPPQQGASNPKKRRKNQNTNNQGPSNVQDLLPPPLSGFGDTIIASNPFDDCPQSMSVNSRSPNNPMGMGPGMNPMGMCRPMGSGMMGSPNQHMMSSSMMMQNQMNGGPMNGPPMGGPSMNGPPMNGPPMNGPMGPNMTHPMMGSPNGPMQHGRLQGPNSGPMSMNPNMGPMSVNGTPNMPPMNNMSPMNTSPMHNPMNGPPNNGMNGPMGSMNGPMNGQMNSPMNGPMNGPNQGMHCPPNNNFMMNPMNMYPKPMPVSAGKIYPADQPMVFNAQNPNAPPIYPCGVCHKEVHDNDQAILCESGCNFWYHRGCTGLTEAAFQLLTQEVYAEWVCDKCLSSKNIPLVKFKP